MQKVGTVRNTEMDGIFLWSVSSGAHNKQTTHFYMNNFVIN